MSRIFVRRLREHRQGSSSKSFAANHPRGIARTPRPDAVCDVPFCCLIALPAFFLGGVDGAFLQSVAVGYGLAILASMVVALTATIAFGIILLPTSPLAGGQSAVVRQLQRGYAAILSRVVKNPRPRFVRRLPDRLGGLARCSRFDRAELMPTFKESDLLVEVESRAGTSHPAMNRIASQATRELRAIPGVRTVSAQVGRAMLSDRVGDVNKGQIWVGLDRNADYAPPSNEFTKSWKDMLGWISTRARI